VEGNVQPLALPSVPLRHLALQVRYELLLQKKMNAQYNPAVGAECAFSSLVDLKKERRME